MSMIGTIKAPARQVSKYCIHAEHGKACQQQACAVRFLFLLAPSQEFPLTFCNSTFAEYDSYDTSTANDLTSHRTPTPVWKCHDKFNLAMFMISQSRTRG